MLLVGDRGRERVGEMQGDGQIKILSDIESDIEGDIQRGRETRATERETECDMTDTERKGRGGGVAGVESKRETDGDRQRER